MTLVSKTMKKYNCEKNVKQALIDSFASVNDGFLQKAELSDNIHVLSDAVNYAKQWIRSIVKRSEST